MKLQTIDEQVDINKSLHNKGNVRLTFTKTYFTYRDLIKLQDFISSEFTNFNGGFGLSSREDYLLNSIPKDDLQFTFCIADEPRSFLTRSFTSQFEFNSYNCVERYGWLETIIRLCEFYSIPFKFDPSIIDSIITKGTNHGK